MPQAVIRSIDDSLAGSAPPASTCFPESGMSSARSAHGNRLLAFVPAVELGDWLPHLSEVKLAQGEVLGMAGKTLRHVYFPSTAILSLVRSSRDSDAADTASVGSDGVVGMELFIGALPPADHVVVHGAGHALRLKGDKVEALFARSATIRSLMLQHSQALACQMAQLAICRRYHCLTQQLCHALLRSLDQQRSSQGPVPVSLVLSVMSCSAEAIRPAAQSLQDLGMIRHQDSHLTVLDRTGLQCWCCGCYQVIRREYARLLTGQAAT